MNKKIFERFVRMMEAIVGLIETHLSPLLQKFIRDPGLEDILPLHHIFFRYSIPIPASHRTRLLPFDHAATTATT